jgi:hypothetical protein
MVILAKFSNKKNISEDKMKKILITFFIIWSCIIPFTYSQIGYECTISQVINSPNLYISLYIRSTGATNFILGSANFRLNVNTSGLNISNIPVEISEGIWDNGNDPINYADQTNGRNAAAGWVSINIENLYNGGGVQVPTTATLIGTLSVPISSTSFNSDASWRTSGLNQTEILDDIGNNITLSGTFTNPPIFPLPVELSSFAAKMHNEDQVKLNWTTQTEVNNYGFDVERQTKNGRWEKVGFVNGNGNSNSPKEYSYIDKSLIGGSKFLYRLKQVDNDGQFEYSDVVEVELVPNEYSLSQNYPNPFNPSTKIRYQLPNESKVVIKVFNILGSEVMELLNEQKQAGIYEAEFNASSLASGTYFYKISAGNFVQTKKMILLK